LWLRENPLRRGCGRECKRVAEIAFSSSLEVMLAMTKKQMSICKDAPDLILNFCTEQWMDEDGKR
jgi:magnesium-transporting ATPase (P-type)